jgi:hypothetical protein
MYKLWLDDYRKPPGSDWIWVKSLAEFKQTIEANGTPALVSYDHDLDTKHYEGDYTNGLTGLEALHFLLNRLSGQTGLRPVSNVHTRNTTRGPLMRKLINEAKLPTLNSEKQNEIMEHVYHQDLIFRLEQEPITV